MKKKNNETHGIMLFSFKKKKKKNLYIKIFLLGQLHIDRI